MKKLVMLALVLGAVMFTGCATHMYQSENKNLSQTEVVLSQKNFKVVGYAEGHAKATMILGIGGLSKKSVRANAVAEMYKAANLKGSQTIININVKHAIVGLPPIYMRNIYTATGTIVEFVE